MNEDILENLYGVAVISALLNSDNIREKSKEFLNIKFKICNNQKEVLNYIESLFYLEFIL